MGSERRRAARISEQAHKCAFCSVFVQCTVGLNRNVTMGRRWTTGFEQFANKRQSSRASHIEPNNWRWRRCWFHYFANVFLDSAWFEPPLCVVLLLTFYIYISNEHIHSFNHSPLQWPALWREYERSRLTVISVIKNRMAYVWHVG